MSLLHITLAIERLKPSRVELYSEFSPGSMIMFRPSPDDWMATAPTTAGWKNGYITIR